jgi:TonB-dependent receptor
LAAGVSVLALGAAPAWAQDDGSAVDDVIVTGQRQALKSAQAIKRSADEIVDSIVADDIGKLPDRSVTEALQRVVGITIDHNMTRGDPEHYSVEGSGVNIRGLSYVRSELNGRDSFSANGGRALNFEDVPPELMAGVDVYKNPSAEQIEGAIGGLVNLRTQMPFNFPDTKLAVSVQGTYGSLSKGSVDPSASILLSKRWDTDYGQFGALIDIAYSESATRTDAFQVEPYYPRTDIVAGETVWIPKGAQWRTLMFDRTRRGAYGALQWRPSDSLEMSLTAFNSNYEMQWDERAIFAQSSPYNIQVANATYDDQGALLTGVLTDPADGGINFGDDTRTAKRKSETTDYSWNVRWDMSDRLTFRSDLQYIKSTSRGFDSTVATGIQIPSETVDLRGDVPVITTDAAFLADPDNYYWAFTMEHLDRSKADEWAWKGDVTYDVEEDSWIRDVRVGVRLTDRTAVTERAMNSGNADYNWAAVTQPWQIGWDIPHLAYLGDPRFSGDTELYKFENFFGGDAQVPAVIFPAVSWATGFPDSYETLHEYHDILCREQNPTNPGACAPWAPVEFGRPAGLNDQEEKTAAAYAQVRFGFDSLPYPIDGNVGVRVVKTEVTAHGFTAYTPANVTVPPGYTYVGPPIPTFSLDATTPTPVDATNSFTNVLPSLNLRMKVGDQLQFRFAAARALARPDFTQLQAFTTVNVSADTTTNTATNTFTVNSVSTTGTGSGNPYLEPTISDQFDLTAEWYFNSVGSLTAALFYKELHDVVINQIYNIPLEATNGQTYNFSTTAPVNGADGIAKGFEIAYQQYYDFLPGALSGLGLQANFTYVDSHTNLYNPVSSPYCSGGQGNATNLNLNQNGCDTDGRTFGNLPLAYLSRTSYNIALLYDKGPISARLAYNWRSRYLQAVNVNGTNGSDGTDTNPQSPTFGQRNIVWGLPTWAEDYGQLDASVFYKLNDRITFGVEAQNINDAMWKQSMQQHIGDKGRAWFVSGPRYTAQIRYSF